MSARTSWKPCLKRKPWRTWNLKLTAPLIIPLLSNKRTQRKSFFSRLFLTINFLEMRSSPIGLRSRAEALLHEQTVVVWNYPPGARRGGQFHSLWICSHFPCCSTGMCICHRWGGLPFLAWVHILIECLLVAGGIIPQEMQWEHKGKNVNVVVWKEIIHIITGADSLTQTLYLTLRVFLYLSPSTVISIVASGPSVLC